MNTPDPNCRLRLPERNQVEIRFLALDQLLPDDHQARVVWAYVEGLDLTPLYQAIQARQGVAGRDANDPRILMALWLYATLDGVGSARRLDQLCQESLPYQWLAGGVSMNYHSLADFRVEHVELLDQLLTQSVAALLHQGLVPLTRVAQDGMKVRASAGSSSFRRRVTLAKCLEQAQAHVAALKTATDEDAAAVSRRQQAARQRAAHERQERVEKALQEAEQLAQRRQHRERTKGVPAKQERASTTDAEARTMKMGDGGFRPAYNAQFATTTVGGVIVGVAATSSGSDSGQMPQMVEQLQRRYGRVPEEMLVDGGFATLEDIQTVHEQHGVKVYAPIKDEKKKRWRGVDPFTPRPRDKEGVALWRQRMGTAAAQAIYRERASAAEWVNALARQRGLSGVGVRGRLKVLAVLLWQALTHNLLRAVALRKAAAG
jgi:transposase